MRITLKTFTLAALSIAMLAMVPSAASAQWGIFGGSGNYNGNYGYDRSSRAMVVNLKNRSREFARRLDRELDRSRYDNSWEEDRLNEMAGDFYRAADELEDNWGNGRISYRTDGYLRRVLTQGRILDRELSRFRLSRSLESDWSRIREDLSRLGNTFIVYGQDSQGDRGGRRDRDEKNDNQGRKKGYPFPF